MRVLHLCLSCFYIDGAGYQENFLVRQHVKDGHDVLVIASTETFDEAGDVSYTNPESYKGSDGAPVVRLPYARWLPHTIARKLRIHPHVYRHIAGFKPDSILFHGCAGHELVTVARYARQHPAVLFYVDSHEDYNNSARSFVSRKILHGLYYRNILQRALPWVRKVLCVSTESIDFTTELYGVPRDRTEFYPLGGFVLAQDEVQRRRASIRRGLGLSEEAFVFIQTGKMTARKKLADSLRAFSSMSGDRLSFLVAGLLSGSEEDEIKKLLAADPRIRFLGWKSPEELTDLFCASDVYVQPGTQSASMQHALCCGCPVIIADVPAHQTYGASGATLLGPSVSLASAFAGAVEVDKAEKRTRALQFAVRHLDYRTLANRVLR